MSPGALPGILRGVSRQLPVAVKIAVPFALITLATSALLAAYATNSARRQLQSGYDAQLRQVQNAVQVVYATDSSDPQQINALLQRIKASDGLVLVANALDSPEAQDPLGLTQAQMEADPRQAPAAALVFDTRKSLRHQLRRFVRHAPSEFRF